MTDMLFVSHQYEYLIALGSNTGDRLAYLNRAADDIHALIGPISDLSFIYETEPIGSADQLFFNAALKVLSNLTPDQVMTTLLKIEKKLGRVRQDHWGNRTIDLDILLVQTERKAHRAMAVVSDSESLTIPHPEMLNRDFVMVPAAEIAGHWIHPSTNSTLAEEVAGRRNNLRPAENATWQITGTQHTYADRTVEGPAPTFI